MILINRKRIYQWMNKIKRFSPNYDLNIFISQGDPGENVTYVETMQLNLAVRKYPNAGFDTIDLLLAGQGKRLKNGQDDTKQYVHVYRYEDQFKNLNKESTHDYSGKH